MDTRDVSDFMKSVDSLSKKSKAGTGKVVFKEFELSLHNEEDTSGPLGEFTKTLKIQGPFIVACEFVKTVDAKEESVTTREVLNSTEISPCSQRQSSDYCVDPLEGSPLKLIAIADLSAIHIPTIATKPGNVGRKRNSFTPVPAGRAQYLLSLYSMARRQKASISTVYPLWVLCDGKKPRNTVCLGISACSSLDKNQNIGSQGQRSTIIKLTGPSSKQSIISSFQMVMGKVMSGKQVSCQAEYDIIGSLSKENPMAGLQGSMKLELKWNKATSLLQTPPVNAETTAKVQVVPGDAKSAGFAFYSELSILKRLVEALSTGEICWAARLEENSTMDELKTVLGNLKLGDAKPLKSVSQSCETTTVLDGEDDLGLELERSDQDFTDFMWNVLKGCSSFSELVQCFQLIFAQLKSGELQPMVHKSNPTTVACLVRDCYTGRLTVPILSKGMLALELLAEMGAEKLSRDYINVFLSQDLTTLKHLDYFAATEEVSLKQKLERLEKLHAVLELVIMLKTFLHSPQATLSTCARQMLQYYENNGLDWDQVFQVPIPTLSIAKLLESAQPCMWQLCLTKSVAGVEESSVYMLSVDPPFQHLDTPLTRNLSDDTLSHDEYLEYFFVKMEDSITFV